MAKRDRGRERSREALGGLRSTQAVRTTVESARRSTGFADVDLDLSAFQPVGRSEATYRAFDPVREVARAQVTRSAGGAVTAQGRRAQDAEPSKRAQQRAAERQAERDRNRAVSRQITKGPKQARNVRPDHSQVEPSRNVREERLHGACKERPRVNKGSGGSRKYVPWCGRKR